MKDTETVLRARALLDSQTPLKKNCGRLCGAACCQSDESGENGMLLYPGEEACYTGPIEGFPYHLVPDDTLFAGGTRLVCEGSCLREHRPLACRVFPLRMALNRDGSVSAEIDPRAWAVCPLPERGGLQALCADFTNAVRQAGELLLSDESCAEALRKEQAMIDEMRRFG